MTTTPAGGRSDETLQIIKMVFGSAGVASRFTERGKNPAKIGKFLFIRWRGRGLLPTTCRDCLYYKLQNVI